MGVARRLYLYSVSAVSLLVLAIGLYNLAALVLGQVADILDASVIGGGAGTGREQVSLAIALVVVGLPVFTIHWWLVERGWRGTDAAAVDDRFSSIRAFHLALVATVSLGIGVYAGIVVVRHGFVWVLGVQDPAIDGPRVSEALALIAISVPIWWYHQHRRGIDLRRDHLGGSAAWLSRLYRYGWAFAGLMLLVTGVSQVLETTSSVLIGRAGFGAGDAWLGSLAWSLATILGGAGVFWFQASETRAVIRDAAIIGEDDRTTLLHSAYFGVVVLVALANVAASGASSLAAFGRWLLGVANEPGTAAFLELVLGPLLVAIPFAVAGWFHWVALRRGAAARTPAALAAAERLELHLASGVGGGFLAIGSAQLLGRLLEVLPGSTVLGEAFRSEMAWFLAMVVVGAALWIPAWAQILRRRAATPLNERLATTSRAYLYFAVGASMIAAVPSAAFSLYRLIDTLLGGRGLALGSELATPVAVVLVASTIAAYHGRLLVADLHLAAEARPPRERAVVVPVEPTAGASAGWTGITRTLTLRATTGVDLDPVVAALRDQLPAGVVLEDGRPPAPRPAEPSAGGTVAGVTRR